MIAKRAGFWIMAAAIAAAGLGGAETQAKTSCQPAGRFVDWKSEFRQTVLAEGVSEAVTRRAFDPVRYDPDVIRRDRRQSFFARSFVDFSKKLVSKGRIAAGKRMLKKRAALFAEAERRYGVPGPVIAAFWALESDFGAGIRPENQHLIFNALATLAYDCRRPELFSAQLIAALKLVESGRVPLERMTGSWAGEIGETQFLPSHVLDFGVDGDGDGRIDLLGSDADVIFSTANFIQSLGWKAGEPWLAEAKVPAAMPWEEADLAIQHGPAHWAAWGVTLRSGRAPAAGDPPAALLLPMGRNGPAFMAYRNFQIYPQWNQSLNYAVTAAYLATRLSGAGAYGAGRGPVEKFSGDEIKALQTKLQARGFDTGGVDGAIGAKTRAAIKAVQLEFGLPADSYPSNELIRRLR